MTEWIPYEEQLKDARWLSIREEVLSRDLHQCARCGKTRYLQVHHKYYESGKLAWEYPLTALVTLCRGCHAKEHGIIIPSEYPYRQIGVSRPVRHIREVMADWVEMMLNQLKE